MSRIPLPREEVEYEIRETDGNTTDHIIPPSKLITCPYNKEHKVPVQDFNAHLWKCRSEKMTFYPHALKLKKCQYNSTHLLPEEEILLHEAHCEMLTEDLRETLNRPQINLKVCELEETLRVLKQMEEDEDPNAKKKESSDVEDSEPEEEDKVEMVKRLTMLDFKKTIFDPKTDGN